MACNNGKCGGQLCQGDDDFCANDASCCTGTCDPILQRCKSAGPCLGTMQSCEGSSCCSGVCVIRASDGGNEGHCDLGPGPCRPTGTICQVDGDCCNGTCAARGGRVKVCSGACAADGQSCTSGADCCGGVCSGATPKCSTGAAQCKLLGEPCVAGTACCSGQCVGGLCANLCTPK
jgi:hypothetical protein